MIDGIIYNECSKRIQKLFYCRAPHISFLLKYKLIFLLILRLLSLYLVFRFSRCEFKLPLELYILAENIFYRLFLLSLFHIRKFIVKRYDLQVFKVLFWLTIKLIAELIFLFPLHTPFKMLKSGLFQLINGMVHVFGPGLLLRHDFPAHDIIMVAESSDFIFYNFRTPVFGAAISHIDELVLIK